MNREQLKSYEPFFGGFFVSEEIERNSEYTAFRVKKRTPDGRTQTAILRSYSFYCEGAASGTTSYPPKLKRLLSDTETMLRLHNCANILKFYEKAVFATEEGYEFFILMQDAMPLTKRVNIENLSKNEVYSITSSVCEALASFRSLGILHRKICPENIFISSTGDYLLGDFGIGTSYIVEDDYMSPEEHRVASDLSSTDIYQTGMLFYKLLNKNRAPFLPAYPIEITEENKRNAFMRRMNGEITGSFEGSTEDEENIVLKACAYAPADRYRNAASFKGDIDVLIRSLAPTGAHDYYMGAAGSPRVIEIEPENDFDEYDEDNINDAHSIIPDYIDEDFEEEAKEESDKIIKALIISIIVIAIIAGSIAIAIVIGKKNQEEIPTTTEPTTESTTIETTTTTETTTEPTTTTTEPTTTTTEPTTTTTEATTTTTETTKFTLPEGFTWYTTTTQSPLLNPEYVDVDTRYITVKAFEEDGIIDEVVLSIPRGFGKYISASSEALLCEYNDGRLIRTTHLETNVMYEDEEKANVTICDLFIPSDFDMDFDNCNYEIVFGTGLISGIGYRNNEFSVPLDATALE